MLLTATNYNYEQNEKGELNKKRKNICTRFPNIKWKQYSVNVEVMFQQIAMYPAKRNGTKGGEKKKYVKANVESVDMAERSHL